MLKIKKTAPFIIQTGLWQNGNRLEAVWFDPQQQVHALAVDHGQPLEIPRRISEQLQADGIEAVKFKFVTAIAPHRIWHKTLILPQRLNEQECRQQCRFVLQHELPVPIEDLWFDYCAEPLQQGLRLDIFAILQTIAKSHLEPLQPLHIDVLDNAAHCMLRACKYLPGGGISSSTLLVYRDAQGCVAVQDKPHQLQLLHQTTQNPTALFQQYCARYQETSPQVVFYGTPPLQELPAEWRLLDTELPLIPLGAALWQKDSVQDEFSH